MNKRMHAWLQDKAPTDDEQRQRARNFDVLIGRPNVPLQRAENPAIEIYDYLRFAWVDWTKTVFEMGGGNPDEYGGFDPDDDDFRAYMVAGVVARLKSMPGINGIQIDTPMEPADKWRCVQLCAEIKDALKPLKLNLMVNFGSWDAWMGLTEAWESLAAVCDYHHVEVFVDVAKTPTIPLNRFAHLGVVTRLNKRTVIGFYDADGTHSDAAAKNIAALPDYQGIAVAYKTSKGWQEIPAEV